jgi:histidinol-phosphate aminotransferase
VKVSPEIVNLVPYKPGKPISETQREYGLTKVIKLASNENALGPSPKALAAVRKFLDQQHRYPDPGAYELIQTLSKKWSFPAECLGVGNGSDELIDLLIRIYCEAGEGILTSQAAFSAYEISARTNRARPYTVPMTKDFKFDLEAMADYFFAHPEKKIRLIFIANPNNPTGSYVNKFEVDRFLKRLGNRDDVLIVFDEAYNEFVRAKDYANADQLLREYSNVVALRTFSKVYGLAGFRVGAMVAPKEVIEIFNRVRKPFNVNDLAQVAAVAALQDLDYIAASQQTVWKGLDYFYEKLQKMKLPFVESQGNFVMFDTLRDAEAVNEALLRRGIILRPIKNYGFPHHLRLSVGLEEENVAAMAALETVLAQVQRKS